MKRSEIKWSEMSQGKNKNMKVEISKKFHIANFLGVVFEISVDWLQFLK